MNLEQALIGCIIEKNDVLAEVADIVTPRDFRDVIAREVYVFIYDRWKNGEQTDLAVLSPSFRHINFKWVLDSVMSTVPTPSMSKSYALSIAEFSKTERIRCGLEGVLADKENNSNDLIFKMSSIAVSESNNDSDIVDSLGCVDEFDKMLDSGGVTGLSTGYMHLDSLDIVLVRGDYWVIGADTSVGKTALALNVFSFLLENDKCKLCLISTEMTRIQILARIISYFTGIPSIVIMRGRAKGKDLVNIKKCTEWLKTKLFFISEKTYEISQIENKIRSLNMKHNIDVFFVDYIQHCRSRGFKKKYDVYTDVSNRLQELAKVTETGCVALSQLSNEVAKNINGKMEFKGAGDIGADCDVGIMLEQNKNEPRKLKAHVKKNRHGARGSFNLMFSSSWSRLEDYV